MVGSGELLVLFFYFFSRGIYGDTCLLRISRFRLGIHSLGVYGIEGVAFSGMGKVFL